MDKVRLNNFILWCKNWYQPIDSRMNIVTQAQKILTLDGYLSCNNPICITLNYIDELVDNDPKYYLDEAFIKEYQKLSIEDKKEMYDFCRFKNSLRDGAEIKEEINKNDKEDIA